LIIVSAWAPNVDDSAAAATSFCRQLLAVAKFSPDLPVQRRRICSMARSLRLSVSEQVTGAIWRIVSYKKPLAF
jgi:hypothetical protein